MREFLGLYAGGVLLAGAALFAAENPVPGVPVLQPDGGNRMGIGLPQTPASPPVAGEGGKIKGPDLSDPGPAPVPPRAPADAALTYYSTCGGTHVPVSYTYSGDSLERMSNYFSSQKEYDNGQSGVSMNEEARQYLNSKEVQDYKQAYDKWARGKSQYEATRGMEGSPQERPNTLGSGMVSAKLDRNPMKDLSAWLEGGAYHQDNLTIQYEQGGAELTSSLEDPLTGPALTASHYGKLVALLSKEAQAAAPAPKDLIASVAGLWEQQWRKNLGFDADATSRQLALDLERAMTDSAHARRRTEDLRKRSNAGELEQLQLAEQRAFAAKELEKHLSREAALRELLHLRLTFIKAIVNLTRLAPDGGFGPTFRETADPKTLQQATGRILTEIGPLAAGPLWQGLCEDVSWLAGLNGFTIANPQEVDARTQSAEAVQALLCDARVDGLAVIAGFLAKSPHAHPATLRKALELLDKLGTKTIRPEALATLPHVIALRKHKDAGVSERARWTLLKLLGLRDGKASMEDAIGAVAPLLREDEPQTVEAAWNFLRANTGQHFSRDAQAWLELHRKMAAERRKVEAEKERLGLKPLTPREP